MTTVEYFPQPRPFAQSLTPKRETSSLGLEDTPKAARGVQSHFRLKGFLPYELTLAANEIVRLMSTVFERQFDLSVTDWNIFVLLNEDGATTQSELIDVLGVSGPTITRHSRKLGKLGYIRRSPNIDDGRSHFIELTETGKDLFARMTPTALRLQDELLEGWDPSTVVLLRGQLDALRRRAAAMGERR